MKIIFKYYYIFLPCKYGYDQSAYTLKFVCCIIAQLYSLKKQENYNLKFKKKMLLWYRWWFKTMVQHRITFSYYHLQLITTPDCMILITNVACFLMSVTVQIIILKYLLDHDCMVKIIFSYREFSLSHPKSFLVKYLKWYSNHNSTQVHLKTIGAWKF